MPHPDEPWREDPLVCGSCIAWRHPDPPERGPEGVPVGTCRLRPELHRVPATLGRCAQYRGRGQPAAPVRPRSKPSRTGRTPREAEPPPPAAPSRPEHWSPEQVRLHRAGREALGGSPKVLHARFAGGLTVVEGADDVEIVHPNERFFAHLCRLADAVDRLETRLSGDEDAIAQIRRIRGSLTTFNFFFADSADHFTGKA